MLVFNKSKRSFVIGKENDGTHVFLRPEQTMDLKDDFAKKICERFPKDLALAEAKKTSKK